MSVDAAIDALGGLLSVSKITGCEYKTVHSWRARQRFPRKTFIVISHALADRGLSGDPWRLWRMATSKHSSVKRHRA